MLISPAYAQAAGGAAPASGALGGILGLAPLFLIFIVFYFLMIRPQQARVRKLAAAVAAAKKGDSVVTAGEDAFVEVEIAPNTRVRVVKATLAEITPLGSKPAND
jgi:preprotein translocase subunit YajC